MNVLNIKKVLKSSVGYCLYENELKRLATETRLNRKEIVDKLKEQDFNLLEIVNNNYTYISTEFIITVSVNGILWFITRRTL